MSGREVLIGVCGGVAAYKVAHVVSQLVQQQHGVSVVLTTAGEQFVGSATFAALTGRPVARHLFDQQVHPLGAHIELASRADLMCVAPATADFLAKAALGLADDLLSTLYLAFPGTVLMAPAMNTTMWEQPSVQRNVETLRGDGVQFVDPQQGWLSCRQQGIGRMADPDTLLAAIQQQLSHQIHN